MFSAPSQAFETASRRSASLMRASEVAGRRGGGLRSAGAGSRRSWPTVLAPGGRLTGLPVAGFGAKNTGMAPGVITSEASTGRSGACSLAGGGSTTWLFAQPCAYSVFISGNIRISRIRQMSFCFTYRFSKMASV